MDDKCTNCQLVMNPCAECEKIEKLQTENAKLREALGRAVSYIKSHSHSTWCDFWEKKECNCGYKKILKQLQKGG